jgi:hypothetical protein
VCTNPTSSSVNSLVQQRHNNFDNREAYKLGPFGRSVTTTLSRSGRALLNGALSRARTAIASVVINGQATGVDPTVQRDLAGSKQDG